MQKVFPGPYSLALAKATDPGTMRFQYTTPKMRVCPSAILGKLVGCRTCRVMHAMCARTSKFVERRMCRSCCCWPCVPRRFQTSPSSSPNFGLYGLENCGSSGRDAESVHGAVQPSFGEGDGPGAMRFQYTTPKMRVCPSAILGKLVGCRTCRVMHAMCARTSKFVERRMCRSCCCWPCVPRRFQTSPSSSPNFGLYGLENCGSSGRDAESVHGAVQPSFGEGDGPGAMRFQYTTPKKRVCPSYHFGEARRVSELSSWLAGCDNRGGFPCFLRIQAQLPFAASSSGCRTGKEQQPEHR